jgi:hypothetical protein
MRKASQSLSVIAFLLMTLPPSVAGPTKIRIEGVVCDKLGAVIPGASVRLISKETVRETTTDQTGHFTFAGLPSGKYDMQASRAGFKSIIEEELQFSEDPTNPISITLQVAPSGCSAETQFPTISYKARSGRDSVVGLVHDLFDGPLVGAAVTITSETTKKPRLVMSGADGEFRFKELEPGKYYLKVSHTNYTETPQIPIWITSDNLTQLTPLFVTKKRETRVIICQ